MADKVTLLDLSFNLDGAVTDLDKLIAKSMELSEKKKQLTAQINAEKLAMAGIRQNYRDNLIDQTTYEKQINASATAIIDSTKKLNKHKNELSETNSAIKAHTTIVNSQAKSVNTLRAQLALNTAELNKMSIKERETGERGQALVKQTKELTDQLKTLEKGVGDTRRNVGNYAEDIETAAGNLGGLNGATGMLVKGMAGGIASVKAFNAALMANPFVAIATAVLFVIQTIGQLMNKNDELATSVKAILAPIQWAITKVLDVVAKLFAGIAKVFEWLADKYLQVYNWLGLISDEMLKNIKTAQGMAQMQRDIYNAETDNLLVLSRQRREMEAQRTIAADQTKSTAERNAAATEALRISKEMEEAEIKVLKAKQKQIEAENGLSYTADEARRKQVEAQAAIEEKQAQYEAQRRELIGQRSGFEKAEADKIAADEKKRNDEAIARAREYAQKKKQAEMEASAAAKAAEDQRIAEQKAAQDAMLRDYEMQVSELQVRLREQNIGIVDKEKAIADQDELNAILLEKERYKLEQGLTTQREYDLMVYEMQVARTEKLAALDDQLAQERQTREATDLANKRAIEDMTAIDDFALRQQRLDEQYQQEIAAAQRIGADTTLIKQKYDIMKMKLDDEKAKHEMQTAAQTAGMLSDLLGQESAAGKQFAVAQATINTYLGATKALAQGGFWGIAQAAIVVAAGFKQVMSIMKVKDDAPKISAKKYAKGGQVVGPSHAQGGVTFKGDNGQVFEVEGGENMYVLNKNASSAINALSRVNQYYGGKSFHTSNVYKYAQGGNFDVISNNSYTTVNKSMMKQGPVDLSQKTIASIAQAFVEGVENAPSPIVSVQEIAEVQQNRNVIIRASLD